ncbi:hypothetical protein T484DRAFT_2592468 [Baffinella frigidus]|nr:hypothetical protein T484DRAFT_2592468 [Cryptophyta sp. CCMP2293]
MSRFGACPVCGINMAMHLLAMHTDAHFSGEQVVLPSNLRDSAEAHRLLKPPQQNTTSSQERLAPFDQKTELKHNRDSYDSGDAASAESATRRPETEDARHGEAVKADTPSPTVKGRGLAQGWSFLKSPSAKDVRGPRRGRKAFDLPPKPFDYLVVLDFEVPTLPNLQPAQPSTFNPQLKTLNPKLSTLNPQPSILNP